MLLDKKANGDKTVPVICEEKRSGSDAIVVKLARTPANVGHWDIGVKFADDRAWSVKPYADIRRTGAQDPFARAPLVEWPAGSRGASRNVQGRIQSSPAAMGSEPQAAD